MACIYGRLHDWPRRKAGDELTPHEPLIHSRMKLTLTTSRPAVFTVNNLKAWTVHLEPIPYERGRYDAISDTRLRCISEPCRKVFASKDGAKPCPKCGGETERVKYRVDVLTRGGHGECRCENYTCDRGGHDCKHLSAAFYLFGKLEAAASAASAERQDGP